MDPTVVITLVVAVCTAIFSSVTAPIILAQRTERMHRADQLEEYRRQDVVAKQAADVAARLLKAQEAEVVRTDEVARLAAKNSQQTKLKLDRIHTLVNSDMTAALQAQQDQAQIMVGTLKRVIQLAQAKGEKPDPEDLRELESAQASITRLEAVLADRQAQQAKVDAEQQVHPIEDGNGDKAGP
jgi:hypothetical protein